MKLCLKKCLSLLLCFIILVSYSGCASGKDRDDKKDDRLKKSSTRKTEQKSEQKDIIIDRKEDFPKEILLGTWSDVDTKHETLHEGQPPQLVHQDKQLDDLKFEHIDNYDPNEESIKLNFYVKKIK